MGDDLVGQIVHIDHGFADACPGQLVQHVIEQRLSGHLHQRLRHMVGQRAHAQAETGGEDHGFGGCNGHSEFLETFDQRCGSYHGDLADPATVRP